MTTGDSWIYSVLSDDKAFGRWLGALLQASASALLALVMYWEGKEPGDGTRGDGKGGRRGGVDF